MGKTKMDICKKCWGAGHVHGGDENSTWSKTCEDCHGIGFVRVPMTNADRIRAMTDEDLAYWIMCPYDSPFCDGIEHNCIECTKEWLQQPTEGD